MTPPSRTAVEILNQVRSSMGPSAERREGQEQMAKMVQETILADGTLLVQAGTGTGKSLAYLSAVVASGKSALVATATKSLQDQLANKDMPQLSKALGGPPIDTAVIKGRSNYVCLAKLHQFNTKPPSDADRPIVEQVVEWVETPMISGERSEAPFAVTDQQWEQVSVGVNECPGAGHCPHAKDCYAEKAIDRAVNAQVVICNTHLLLLDQLQESPRFQKDCLIVDEAHELPEIATHTLSVQITVGGLKKLASRVSKIAQEGMQSNSIVSLMSRADNLAVSLENHREKAISGEQAKTMLRGVQTALLDVRKLTMRAKQYGGSTGALAAGLDRAVANRLDAIDIASDPPAGWCAWVNNAPQLMVSPVEPGGELSRLIYNQAVILCSATLRTGPDFKGIAKQVGADSYDSLDVGSPFDYAQQAALYCDPRLPRPSAQNTGAVIEEYVQRVKPLLRATHGSALLLFTSWRMLGMVTEELTAFIEQDLGVEFLVQGSDDKARLVKQFVHNENSVLAGTMGMWSGLDAVGSTCRLVVVDKLPFSAPDPLIEARRQKIEKEGGNPFMQLDLPRAAVMLSQGVGRLIRSRSDHGLVAVMDPRLVKAGYASYLRSTLPPMHRITALAEAEKWLKR